MQPENKDDFRESLLKLVSHPLMEYHYRYDDALRDRNISYSFTHDLGNKVTCEIRFQRRSQNEKPQGYGFRVTLRRQMIGEQNYEGMLSANLNEVLRYVYAIGSENKHLDGWAIKNSIEFKSAMEDILWRLKEYGIPWLENPLSRNPAYVHPEQREGFRQSVIHIAAPLLQRLGYELHETDIPQYVFFQRPLDSTIYSHIFFQQIYRPDQNSLMFQVFLLRNESPHELDFNNGYDLYKTLSNLLWIKYGNREYAFDHWWVYKDKVSLQDCLIQALDLVCKYGIPWLEDLSESHGPLM